jgi:hypothetical protein
MRNHAVELTGDPLAAVFPVRYPPRESGKEHYGQ